MSEPGGSKENGRADKDEQRDRGVNGAGKRWKERRDEESRETGRKGMGESRRPAGGSRGRERRKRFYSFLHQTGQRLSSTC